MIFIQIFFILLLNPTSQELKLVKSLPLQAITFTTDNTGNYYIVSPQNEIIKHKQDGTLLATYDDKTRGEISSVNTSIPLEVFLFYQDQHQIVYLDNTMSQKSTIDLEQYNLTQVSLACPSYDKGIWVYDEFDFELKKYDTQLNLVQKSGNLNSLVGTSMEPNYLTENNDWVYLNNPTSGILVLDIYGTYSKTIPILAIDQFQVKGDYIYYLKENKLHSYHIKTLEDRIIFVEGNIEFNSVRVEKERVFLMTKDQLYIYEITF
ncbi:MAG: hypothetical protein JKY33_06965 [Bacteroidia bacterium]|nr:hypothetical protein [Bacteroidia bacterium]